MGLFSLCSLPPWRRALVSVSVTEPHSASIKSFVIYHHKRCSYDSGQQNVQPWTAEHSEQSNAWPHADTAVNIRCQCCPSVCLSMGRPIRGAGERRTIHSHPGFSTESWLAAAALRIFVVCLWPSSASHCFWYFQVYALNVLRRLKKVGMIFP